MFEIQLFVESFVVNVLYVEVLCFDGLDFGVDLVVVGL